jgi:hypothetical protein
MTKGDSMSKPIKDKSAQDDAGTAPESGEPAEAGRNRGQVVEPRENRQAKDRSNGTGEELEEGRHEAAPRSGA